MPVALLGGWETVAPEPLAQAKRALATCVGPDPFIAFTVAPEADPRIRAHARTRNAVAPPPEYRSLTAAVTISRLARASLTTRIGQEELRECGRPTGLRRRSSGLVCA